MRFYLSYRYQKRVIVFLLSFFSLIQLQGQDTFTYQSEVDSLILESNRKYATKNYKDALKDIETTIELYTVVKSIEDGYALVLYMKGYTLAALKNYLEAEKALLESIETYEQYNSSSKFHYSAYTQLANVYRKKFDKEKAKECYVKSVDLRLKYFDASDDDELNKLVINAGSLYRVGYSDLALKYFDTILDSFKVHNLEFHYSLFGVYNTSGILNKNKGNYDLAFKDYKHAERILSHNNLENSYKASIVHVNYGILNKLKSNYTEALKDYERALNIQLKVFETQPHRCANVLSNLAQIHSRLGNEELSIDYANQAVELNKRGYGEAHSRYLMSYMFREEVFYTLNKKSVLIEEEKYFDSLYILVHKDLDYTYLKFKAGMFRKAKEYKYAAELLEEGIAKYNEGLGSFLHQSFRDPINLYAAMGEVCRESYFDNSKNIKTLMKAGDAYDIAVDHLANSKKKINLTSSASEHINSMSFVLRDAMITYQELFEITGDDLYLNRMLLVSSLIKNIDLDIKMSSENAFEYANVSESDLEKIQLINDQRDTIEMEISDLSSKSDTLFVGIHERLMANIEQHEEWFSEIEIKYPKYYSFKHGFWNNNLQDLRQEKIGKDELLIDYVQFDSLFYVISIGNEKAHSRSFVIDSSFLTHLSMFLFNSERKSLAETDNVLQLLYKQLLSEEIIHHGSSIKKLTISTDANLSAFPFEILKADEYLVKRYDIRYIHAIDFNYKFFGKPKRQLGVFAPEYDALELSDKPNNQPMAMLVRGGEWMLPGAQEESSLIANLFNGELFTGDLSTMSKFITNSPNYRSLHLSMHTVASDTTKTGFALIFPNDSIASDYSLLKDDDIYNLNLNAELVVLSACNTGKGEYKKGSGVKSLANSFFFAGVPSTVMSFWKVPDDQTSKIMVDFYKNLDQGNSKSKALRKSKIDYLNNVQTEDLKHPFYWAGFVIIGNDDPIDLSSNLLSSQYLWLFILPIILLILFLSKSKQS